MANLLVIAEHDRGQLKLATLAAVACAHKVVAEAGGSFDVLVIGQNVGGTAELLRSYGAATVLVADDAQLQHPVGDKYAQVIADVAKQRGATMVIGAASTFSKDILPRAAALLDAGMLSDVIDVRLVEGDFIFKRVMFAGNVIATVKLDGAVKFLTVRAAAFAQPPKGVEASPVVGIPVEAGRLPAFIEYGGREAKVSGRPDSTEARVVVSGGRGIRNAEDFERLVGGLADALGGAVGSSRALVDAGITPNSLQVGQTGKIVAPDLYVAVGISGAIQHLAGMKDTKVIVAINKDPEAPIFEVADFGLVGDAYQLVPELVAKLKKYPRRMIQARETFGNIPNASVAVFYCLTVATMAVFANGVWRRFRLWRQGVPISVGTLFVGNLKEIWSKLQPGLRRLLSDGLGQARVRSRGLPSLAHIWLFIGFMVLLLGTTMLEIDHIVSWVSQALKFHKGTYYVIYEFTLDIFGLLFLAGCLLFLWRRLRRPPSVGHRGTDWYVILSFLGIGITGYLTEALRMIWQHPTGISAHCSPVGMLISGCFSGMSESSARCAHLTVWWIHSMLVFGFIGSLPYTRLFHTIAGPLNLFFAQPVLGRMVPVTMEEVEKTERIGVSAINHFNQQQLLSLDACMECGRCEEACPAFATEKPLSPKRVVQDLKGLMTWNLRPHAARTTGTQAPDASSERALHDETIQIETLWSCTTCSACARVCPVRLDPVTLITDLRRNRLGEGALSGTAATALRRMQSSGNPWGLPAAERANWAEGTGAPTVKENPSFELLYWVGCAGSYDRRAQRVTKAIVKLLKHAGVNFAILGNEEKCTGDSARRLGDEFLFQELAEANIATLTKYNVRRILTHCPHCLNSLRKDYPQFGGNYTVVHHTEFLQQLLAEGRLLVPEGSAGQAAMTYHDPCYLARVNGIHQAPRNILTMPSGGRVKSPASGLREMPRRREKTFCCGAGGGRMWMEEEPQKRVSSARAKEALATGATTVAVGCPFCLTMITDGVAAQTDSTRVMDVAEILAERLQL